MKNKKQQSKDSPIQVTTTPNTTLKTDIYLADVFPSKNYLYVAEADS